MSTVGTIGRRSFLIGSAAVMGGVAFGTYRYRKPSDNPLLDDLPEGAAAINPYVLIDSDGVTLITPRADKGQGAYSVQAMVLAEELDIDPHRVRLDPGKPSATYYNGKVMAEAAPVPAYDESEGAERLRGMMEVPAKLMGMQMTGGSSTVPDIWEKYREAGAVARETLKAAASSRTGVPAARLSTENGAVLLPDGTRIDYTELAVEAAVTPPARNVPLRPSSAWKYIGRPFQRTDIVAKSTGTETYGIDLAFDDMLYGTVRTNPGMGGKMLSFHADDANKMRGVLQVVELENGVGVIADNTWRAIRAAESIAIEWEAPDYPATSDEMWDVVTRVIEDDAIDTRNRDDGDVDAALATGDVLAAEYRVPYLAHAPLEPMNAVVKVSDERIDIWTGTQIPRYIQDHVAAMTTYGAADVHVHVQKMGGSFGRRLEDTYVLQAVELALKVPGKALKMTWSREEDMSHDYPRPMQMSRARGKVEDGKVVAYDLTVASQSVAASWFGRLMGGMPGPDATIVAGSWDQPFAIPNYRVTGKRVPEMVPVSSWRSVGASGNGFLHGGFLDELFDAAGIDPMDGLIDLCHHETSIKVLEELKALSGWTGRDLGPDRGRGVAYCLSFGVPTAEVVEVTNTEQGIRVDQVYVVADVGTVVDPINIEAQMSGGVIWGLGHAMNCELTYRNYAAEQSNFHVFQGMRLNQAPKVATKALENGKHVRGIGEPGVPPAAPALANAIFAATGQRIRELPLNKHIRFV